MLFLFTMFNNFLLHSLPSSSFESFHSIMLLAPLLLLLLFLPDILEKWVNGESFYLFLHFCTCRSDSATPIEYSSHRDDYPSGCHSTLFEFRPSSMGQSLFLLLKYLNYCFADHMQLKGARLSKTRQLGCHSVHVPVLRPSSMPLIVFPC